MKYDFSDIPNDKLLQAIDKWVKGDRNRKILKRRLIDSMGRYSREYRDDYSRDDARNDMIHDLRALMNDARDDKTRAKFQRFIDEIQNG